jgi:hypothetical protein
MTSASAPNSVLADLARAEAERHRPRTPQRRAAAWLWAILCHTRTLEAARRALADIPDPRVRDDATRLLRQLADEAGTTTDAS